jgi:hypothetical protein
MKGIKCTSNEVNAILAGDKGQIRLVIKPQPIQPEGFSDAYFDCYNKGNQWNWWTKDDKQFLGQIVKCPYKIGDLVFVKESFSRLLINEGHKYYYPAHLLRECVDKDNGFHYWADGNPEFGDWESPKPSTHMKQHQSRITLRIKDISVERLQNITPFDCVCEGVWDGRNVMLGMSGKAVEAFGKYWNATHKKPEEKFEANPWVWKILFEVVK